MTPVDSRPSLLNKRALFDEMLCETGDVLTISTPGALSTLPAGINCEKLRWVTVGPNPVKNLETDAFGIYGTLSFGGRPTHIFLAWDEVDMIVCELLSAGFRPVKRDETPRAAVKESVVAPMSEKKARPAHLRLVK